MTTIKKGEVIFATNVKSGTGGKGAWFMCKVGEKKQDEITVWNNDGFTCNEGDQVKIVDILEVKKGNRKYNEKWYATYDVTAVLEVVGAERTDSSGLEEIDEDDDPLPF